MQHMQSLLPAMWLFLRGASEGIQAPSRSDKRHRQP